jgi:DNA polymerase III delta prime subunit
MSKLLVDKYRPRHLDQVIGQDTAIFQLKRWAQSWKDKRPAYKSAFLYGPAGVGKSSAVAAVSNDFNWKVVEINASERLPKEKQDIEDILQQITLATKFADISGNLNLIAIEEIDGLVTGRPVKKFLKFLEKIIEISHNPIIITCNDEYGLKRVTPYYRHNSLTLRFSPLKANALKGFLQEVLRIEGIEQPLLDQLIDVSKNDLRYCLNNLQVKEIVPRHEDQVIFQIVHDIFRGEWDGDSSGVELDLIWYAVETNIDNFYNDIHGMSVADFKILVDRFFALKKIMGRRQGVKESFTMMKWVTTLLKSLPLHQKTAKIELLPSPTRKAAIDDVIKSYAHYTHQSFEKARLECLSYPELLEKFVTGRRNLNTFTGEESLKTTDSVFLTAEPVSMEENVKAVPKQQSLF